MKSFMVVCLYYFHFLSLKPPAKILLLRIHLRGSGFDSLEEWGIIEAISIEGTLERISISISISINNYSTSVNGLFPSISTWTSAWATIPEIRKRIDRTRVLSLIKFSFDCFLDRLCYLGSFHTSTRINDDLFNDIGDRKYVASNYSAIIIRIMQVRNSIDGRQPIS